ncbi:MAG: FliI/YscN family ATPase [Phycisphaeraceae bacterium]|nr:FliI/YscN family ATPase [Phycisphaeraceae bacterium]
MSVLAPELGTLACLEPMRISGRIAALKGLSVMVESLPLPAGALVSIRGQGGGAGKEAGRVWGEVVGFDSRHTIVMLLGSSLGLRVGDEVVGEPMGRGGMAAPVGARMLGRVVNGLGTPLDGLGPIRETEARPLIPAPISAMERRRISEPLYSGVRAIDLMTTLGRGQRVGIFSGPGVGKSTLLGTIARSSSADVNVIALIGERGREVKDFLEHTLGPDGRAKSVVVVATSDESPLLRIRAALLACTVAERFRDAGRNVLLMMDSVTRFAHAQRQVGLSIGEPPATKGYTPSVFAMLPALLERAGAVERGGAGGSITGLYTVLVEGDDMTEPIADAARGVLDGHIILSRKLAQRAHFPAVDVLDSISRVADDVCDKTHIAARQQVMRLLAAYRDAEDLIQIGAYAAGSNPEVDVAIEFRPRVLDLLRQGKGESTPFAQARDEMVKIAMESGESLRRRLAAKPAGRR